MMDFLARKQAVLQALASQARDKSKKGGVDSPIRGLIERINQHPCYVTTSSCSGRVSVFLEPAAKEQHKKKKKKGGEWVYVSHEPADAGHLLRSVRDKYLSGARQGLLVFKYEPFILALDCSSAAAGHELVACAVAAGFRESGITSLGKRVIVAVRCSIRLEVPIARAGKLLVSEEYLGVLTDMANAKMDVNRDRTDKFMDMFVAQVETRLMASDATTAGKIGSQGATHVVEDVVGSGSEHEQVRLNNQGEGDSPENSGESVDLSGSRMGDHCAGTVCSGSRNAGGGRAGEVLRRRSLLQLETRQARLMARLQAFETRLVRQGVVPTPQSIMRMSAAGVEDSLLEEGTGPQQQPCRGEADDTSSPELDDEVTAGPQNFTSSGCRLNCDSPWNLRRTDELLSKKHRTADVVVSGWAISDACSLLAAAPFTVTGEPVEKLHRWSHSACAVPVPAGSKDGGAVIIFGGYGGTGRHSRLNDVLLLELESSLLRSVQAENAPSCRQAHSSVVVDDKMVLIGGREGPTKPLSDVCVFNITSRSWTVVPTSGAAFPARQRHAAVAVGSHIYVFGGMNGLKVLDDLHVLDTDLWRWTKLNCQGEVPCARHSHAMAAVGQKIFLFGGRNEKCIFGDLYVLEVHSLHWTRVETTGNSPCPRFSHSMTLCGNFLVVLGGCPITKTVKEVFLLHLGLLAWRSETLVLPTNRLLVRHAVCAAHNNKLLVIGGGAACFAFGAAFNSPFLLDLQKVFLPERFTPVQEHERWQPRSARSQGETAELVGAPLLAAHELDEAPIISSTGAAEIKGDLVYVLNKRDGKLAKDLLKKLGWLDFMRKAKILSNGQDIAFPLVAAAATKLGNHEELQDAPPIAASLIAHPPSEEEHVKKSLLSRLLVLRGSISRKTLPVDRRRSNTTQRSLQRQVGLLLQNHNLSLDLLSELPKRWERLGDMAVLPASSFQNPAWQALGMDLWIVLAKAFGVCRIGRQAAVAATGTRDSRLELLLGHSGWVEHRENGILYCFDATKCMFSSGNVSEKLRMASIQCSGEVVVDLFAGIGYFTLPFLLKGGAKHVYACEWNPNALDALRHNLQVNHVEDRCTILEGDNRLITLERVASRVCLGLLPSSEGSWHVAVRALRREGGMLHVHETVKDTEEGDCVAHILRSLTKLACSQGLQWQISVAHVERVKWYAPHIRHIVVDVICMPLAEHFRSRA